MFSARVLLLLTFAIVGTASRETSAALVRHEFAGTITKLEFYGNDPFGGQLVIGSSFNGFYEFDSEQTPGVGDPCQVDLVQCYRSFSTPPYRFSANVGGDSFENTGPDFDIRVNDSPTDGVSDFYAVEGNTLFGGVGAAMLLALQDATRAAIDDPLNLFLDPPDLNDFPTTREFQINSNIGFVHGELTSLSAVPVPEPTTLAIWSLLSGIGLVVGHRRRRRKAA